MFTREPENERCPLCGSIMVDGRCEDKNCEFHWQPPEPEDLLEIECGEESRQDAG